MSPQTDSSDDDLPDARTIFSMAATLQVAQNPLRRSPRKKNITSEKKTAQISSRITLSATSAQRRLSPAKSSPSKRSPLKTEPQSAAKSSVFDDIPVLPPKTLKITTIEIASAENRQAQSLARRSVKEPDSDGLLGSFARLYVQSDGSDAENKRQKQTVRNTRQAVKEKPPPLQAAKSTVKSTSVAVRTMKSRIAARFVLDEARCDEDLVVSDGPENDDDEDTDLSGFIVDDDAEISYHESSEGVDSEEERRTKRNAERQKPRPQRRLQRGRKKVEDTDDDLSGDELALTMSTLRLNGNDVEHRETREIEVIDLTSPEQKLAFETFPSDGVVRESKSVSTNLFDKFRSLKLSPPKSTQSFELPIKPRYTMWSSSAEETDADTDNIKSEDKYTTPPVTPPLSPTKLKSPKKLLSPSRRNEVLQRSPTHRQSTDAFWDLHEVNEWNDQYSPKKAPIASPRKNRLAEYFSNQWSDDEDNHNNDIVDDSFEAINNTSTSLPSPCESPSKSKSRITSPIKAEKQRLQALKRAQAAEKKLFEETKDKLAYDLLVALDKNITNSAISTLSSTTGGVQILWSNTLRSTAGRANWRRTVTKPSGSPVKGNSDEEKNTSLPSTTIKHFANIELAVKVIDRPERLVNTLAHEFCHLANFMVSGVRDQPHGASFQTWARKVTAWMKKQDEVPAWKSVEVTTKHGYVIEWKYLWICAGRQQNKAMEYLGIDGDDEGCGAEYGRHSKSVDVETQRCGRCQGRLVQVRPKPRASPVKSPVKKKGEERAKGVEALKKMIEVVELSD